MMSKLESRIGALYHGDLGFMVIFHDRVERTITAGEVFYKQLENESDTNFLARIKETILSNECEIDALITVTN